MATNADDADDSKQVTEEDLRNLKYNQDEVETDKADETTGDDEAGEDSEDKRDTDGQTDESQDESDNAEEPEDDSQYVKEFPNIKGDNLEEYARNLETAYKNSTSEALRLKGELDKGPAKQPDKKPDKAEDTSDPVTLFMKQKMDEEITQAYDNFSKNFPQVQDATEYDKFTIEVALLSQTIMASQKRLAPPRELYQKAAVILGWEPQDAVTKKDKLGIALKDSAAVAKTSSGTKKSGKSKVTDQMIAVNRLMYPNKTDAQIREELEEYV